MAFLNDRKIVLTALVGSHNYNLNTPASDTDWKHFVAPTFADLYHGVMFSDANTSETLDYSAHDIRQLANLLWKGNVNFLEVLHSRRITAVDGLHFLIASPEKWSLMNIPYFINATYGMHLQKMGSLMKGTSTTTHLVETFGYDTKQACHALRCLYVLERFARLGVMRSALWFEGVDRAMLLQVKAGMLSHDEFLGVVKKWHDTKHQDTMATLKGSYTAQLDVKEELDDLMFAFVKANLF